MPRHNGATCNSMIALAMPEDGEGPRSSIYVAQTGVSVPQVAPPDWRSAATVAAAEKAKQHQEEVDEVEV
jgi:hypothetical protein